MSWVPNLRRYGKRIAVAAYALIGLGTFGHGAAYSQRTKDAEYAACQKSDPKGYCWHETGPAAVDGILAGLAWPLYWSWELQQ